MLAHVLFSLFYLLDPEPLVHSKVGVISSNGKKTEDPSTYFLTDITLLPYPQTKQESGESNSCSSGFSSFSGFSKVLLQLYLRAFLSLKMYRFLRKFPPPSEFVAPYLIPGSEKNQERPRTLAQIYFFVLISDLGEYPFVHYVVHHPCALDKEVLPPWDLWVASLMAGTFEWFLYRGSGWEVLSEGFPFYIAWIKEKSDRKWTWEVVLRSVHKSKR